MTPLSPSQRAFLIALAIFTLSWAPPRGARAQQAGDTGFDVAVEKPAYTTQHPRVLVDQAHFNVHTMSGQYKPFADLITNDGCTVAPNDKPFSGESLASADILVIANARATPGPTQKPAFTEAECDAVRDWVKAGGKLLFVTDHYPTGYNAEMLGQRFGISMSKGVTLDPAHSDPATGGPSTLVYSLENKLLADRCV